MRNYLKINNLGQRTFYIISIVFLITACQKDTLFEEAEGTKTDVSSSTNTFIGGENQDGFFRSGHQQETILGRKRENPFTVEKMTQARAALIQEGEIAPDYPPIVTTNLYVKFCPTTIAEYVALLEYDLVLYDYPLEYEVIEMGEYYIDPNLEDGEVPCFYAIVPPNSSFTGVAYEVVGSLHIPEPFSKLKKRAFDMTGNELKMPCVEENPNYPYCVCQGLEGIEQQECMECAMSEDYADCIGQFDDGSGGTGGGGGNGSLCSAYTAVGGSIRVEDTELGLDGIKNVKVILKDNWFSQDVVYTDENGCFNLAKNYHGDYKMWVEFKNDEGQIRTPILITPAQVAQVAGWVENADFPENLAIIAAGSSALYWAVLEYLRPVKDFVGELEGPIYNNISVTYPMYTAQNSIAHRYWSTAHVHNSLQEFHANAIADGIPTPPEDLDIFVGLNNGFGFATMTSQMTSPLLLTALLLGNPEVIAPVPTPGGGQIGIIIDNMRLFLLLMGSAPALEYAFPDVFIGGDHDFSDEQKLLAYHELAHTSHYQAVGAGYWMLLVVAEVAADGHGNPMSVDAGRIAVCEGWADHIGYTYTHEYYLGNNSITTNGVTWEIVLDRFWHEDNVAIHIPTGLFHDLIDTSEPITSFNNGFNGNSTTSIVDNVSGFTQSQMFTALTNPAVITIPAFQSAVTGGTLPAITGNSVASINDLFAGY